jgi:hypothetical protein
MVLTEVRERPQASLHRLLPSSKCTRRQGLLGISPAHGVVPNRIRARSALSEDIENGERLSVAEPHMASYQTVFVPDQAYQKDIEHGEDDQSRSMSIRETIKLVGNE